MRAFLISRDVRTCSCGRTLWAVMGETPDGECILSTLCATCDLTREDGSSIVGDGRGTNPGLNDSGASAQKA